MGYRLGVDLGTTYTAAAVLHDRPEIIALGNRAAEVPSVVFLREDGTFVIGEPAEWRGAVAPQRLAREFKRRIGDDKPYLLAGTPFAAHVLTAKLLRWVVDRVSEREGSSPDHVVVTHPANWGPHKREVLQHATSLADLQHVGLATEPECAALRYASMRPLEPGAVVAVYDLGGGTFDTSVLTRTPSGFEVRGAPAGIELLGGVDFDEAILNHVLTGLGVDPDELDLDDQATRIGHARLRRECVNAKEALSQDTEIFVSVGLPGLQTDVRVTRGEFEDLIRPAVGETVAALQRALRGAKVEPEDLTAVLLAGGSSRIPLVTEMLSAQLGRPVAIDAHPKHLVATGAALLSASAALPETTTRTAPTPGGLGRWRGSTKLKPKRLAAGTVVTSEGPSRPVVSASAPPDQQVPVDPYPDGPGTTGTPPRDRDRSGDGDGPRGGAAPVVVAPVDSPAPPERRRRTLIVAGAVVAAVLAVAGIVLALPGDGEDGERGTGTDSAAQCPAPSVVPPAEALPNGRISLLHRRDAAVDTWVSRQDGSQVVHEHRHAESCYPYSEGRWVQGDVNGDARPDLVHRRSGTLTTWLSQSPSTFTTVDSQGDQADYPFSDGQWEPYDADLDGRVDLVHVTADGLTTWTSEGDGTYTVGAPATAPDYPYLDGQWVHTAHEGADTLFHVTSSGVRVWRAGPDGQLAPTQLPAPGASYPYAQGRLHIGDLNGDDRSDLIDVRQDGVTTWQSRTDGSYAVFGDNGAFGTTYDFFSGEWRTGDVTGNGRDELLHLFGGGVNTWAYAAADGYRFFGPTYRFSPPDHVDDTVDWQVREVTGDGRDDVLLVWRQGVDVWISKGAGQFERVPQQVPEAPGDGAAPYPYEQGEWY